MFNPSESESNKFKRFRLKYIISDIATVKAFFYRPQTKMFVWPQHGGGEGGMRGREGMRGRGPMRGMRVDYSSSRYAS